MLDSLFADMFGFAFPNKATEYLTKAAVVAAAFLVGWVGGALGAVVVKAPNWGRVLSPVTATALAILVGFFIFGDGGNGLLGGGGADNGKGEGQPATVKNLVETPPKKDEPKPPVPAPTPPPEDIRVTILAGEEVKDGRFYVIDGDPAPKTFAEFKEVINARLKNTTPS